jgi:3-dehydroquinate dehydratase-2
MQPRTILIINGPNLNLLGKREPAVYGTETFDDFFSQLQNDFPAISLSYYQSNIEGELIDKIQEAGFGEVDGIILNAAAYTHTSVGIADAVKAISCPVIEVHISNTYAREAFRHHSYIAPYAKGVIAGFGLHSYTLALQSFLL